MLSRITPAIALAGVLCSFAFAGASPLEEGNRAYAEGKFEEARKHYRSALEPGSGFSNVWYNLGNADYRLGDKGAAALAYERALIIDPGHAEAKFNLNHLRRETGARLPAVSLLERPVRAPEAWLGKRAVPWIAVVAFWAALFLLIPLFGRRSRSWIAGITLLLVAAWAGSAWMMEIFQGERWLIVAAKGQARVAPVASAKALGLPLPAGSEVRLLQDSGDWVYVRLPDATRGWLPRKETEPVIPRREDRPSPAGIPPGEQVI